MLTATDGQGNGGGGVDKFRIKIWDAVTEEIVYDNKMGEDDDSYETQGIACRDPIEVSIFFVS